MDRCLMRTMDLEVPLMNGAVHPLRVMRRITVSNPMDS